jgi:methanogenic corrinoid protein MtbC1
MINDELLKKTDPGLAILKVLEEERIGKIRKVQRGRMLYWQGDPVESIFAIRSGAMKAFSTSLDGKTFAYGIIGVGGIIGVTSYLLGNNQDVQAEALDDSEVISIQPDEFGILLVNNPVFSLLLMRKLAEEVSFLARKVLDFGSLDVQQRLKHRLVELAREYGVKTDKGIRINLDITHEEIGALVNANRTTITRFLNELERQGYLWKEGRNIAIIYPEHIEILDNLSRSIVDGSEEDARIWTGKAIETGVDAIKALDALCNGMKSVDRMFNRDELDVSDVILSAFAMKSVIPTIEAEIEKSGKEVSSIGTIVIGTVSGDIHDIGRTLVAMLLKARGFIVIDLGHNVSVSDFVEAVRNNKPDILAMSSLMTPGRQEQIDVIRTLIDAGLRERLKIIVGGSAITQDISQQMGADGYEPSAHRAVELAWRLMHSE